MVTTQVRILPVVGGIILGGLDTKASTTVRTDHKALEQVNPGRLLSGFGNNTPAGTDCLGTLPQLLSDDRLMFAFRDLGGVERKLTPFGRTVIPR